MKGGFVNHDPIDHSKLYQDPKAVKYFEYEGWIHYFQKLDDYHEWLTEEFARNFWKHDENTTSTKVRGLEIKLNENVLSIVA